MSEENKKTATIAGEWIYRGLAIFLLSQIFLRTYEVPALSEQIKAVMVRQNDLERALNEKHESVKEEVEKIKNILFVPHSAFKKKDHSYVDEKMRQSINAVVKPFPRRNEYLIEKTN